MAEKVDIDKLPQLGGRKVFGRALETAWLDACWRDGAHVASIIAPGGVGKSALVWDWLRRMQAEGWRGADRVYGWSFYSQGTKDQMTSADQFVSAALRWLGDPAPDEGSPWEKGKRLAGLVREKRTLLVLDGVEPLQWGPGEQEGKIKDPALATLVHALGTQSTGLCVITSRIAVREVADFAPEKCPRRDLGTLSDEAGAQVLRDWKVKGSEEELRGAAREYGGHSLALSLLGSYLTEVAEGDVRQRREIGPLVYDERLGGHARRVMAAYETMLGIESAEVGILRMLGLFDRPAGEDEIAALRAEPVVAGLNEAVIGLGKREWNRAVERLRRLGILERAGSDRDRRIDAHPLVREHFGEQLRVEKPEAWREGHRRLYELLKGKAKPLPETIDEMAPLYAAVVHGCRAGRNQEALEEVWWKRIQHEREHFNTQKLGAFGSEVAVLSAFFDPPWERLAPGLTEAAEAFVLNEAGRGLGALGRLPEAAELLRMGLGRDIAREDWENAAISASNLSRVLQTRGVLREALEQARRSVELADRSGDAFQRGSKRTTLAAIQHAMGLREEAVALFEEAERMHKERQPAYPRLYSLQGFLYCDLLLDQERDAEVRERAAQTLGWSETHRVLLDIALDHLSLGRPHLLGAQRGTGGDLAEAASHLTEAVDGLRLAGHQEFIPLGLLARAALHIHTRAFDDARADLDEALSLAERCGFRLHEADAHLGYARLCLAEGEPEAARDHVGKARAIVEETGYHRRDGELEELAALVPEGAEEVQRQGAKAQRRKKAKEMGSSEPRTHDPTGNAMTAPENALDLAVVVALQEELDELLGLVGPYTPDHGGGLDLYRFDRGAYRCGVTLVGEMGQTQAARVTERLIAQRSPGSIVVVGVTGGIHDDLRVGDVHVPVQADEYMQNGKVNPTQAGGFGIVPGAPAYRANFALLSAVRRFKNSYPDAYKGWLGDARADLGTLIPDTARDALFAGNLVRPEVKLLSDGYVATGPVVGAAAAFSAWIRSHNRNIKSLEMESAAVLLVADAQDLPTRALAIRGISDFGDDRKPALDRLGGGVLRQYAMRNAVRLLLALLDVGAWPRAEAKPDPR